MSVIGVGVLEILFVAAAMFGGAGMSVPLPPDAGLQKVAPQECLVYISHGGLAAPQSGSKNQVEALLAEPEIRAFAGEIDRLIDEGLKLVPAENEQQRVLARNLPIIVRTLLERPSITYLAKVDIPPAQPSGNAALIVSAGDRADALVQALEELEGLYLDAIPPSQGLEKSTFESVELRRLPAPPDAPPFVWGRKDSYVFFAMGEKEAEAIVSRLSGKGEAPQWLADLQAELDVPRLGGLVYVNVAGTLKTAEPLFPMIAEQAPPPLRDIPKLLEDTGLGHLRHLALAAGLDETQAVTKVSIAHDGKPTGFLKLGDAKPLSLDDFRQIARDVEFAAVGRFDAKQALDAVLKIVEAFEPRAREEFDREAGRAAEQLGFSIEDDLLAGLGDTWTIYNSSQEGGLLLTGLCVSVGVRDRAKLEKVLDRVLRMVAQETRDGDRPSFQIRKTEADGKTISYAQILGPSPVAPAWCFSDDKLIVASSPQMVRAHLTRPADAGSLADNEFVQAHLKSGDVTSLTFQDTQLGLQVIYSYAQFMATLGAGMLEKETGIRADLAKFPSLGAISRHMRPSISVTRSAKSGFIMENYSVGPSISLPAVGGVFAGLLLPAVQEARLTAQRNTSLNNLRNLGLAMIMYEARTGSLPRDIVDKEGKPLLSWRVAILPDIDQAALYEEFHLDEPWDSEHNAKLISRMPPTFATPANDVLRKTGATLYQLPTGPGTLYDAKKLSMTEISRAGIATSRAVLLVEAAADRSVIWTGPADLPMDVQNYASRLSLDRNGTTALLRLDGSVIRQSVYDTTEMEESLFPR